MKALMAGFILFVLNMAPLATFATSQCVNIFLGKTDLIATPVVSAKKSKLNYWIDKIKEIPNYDRSNIYASILRISIMMSTKKTETEYLPLSKLFPIHEINFEEAKAQTLRRAQALSSAVGRKRISISLQDSLIPSKNPIQVVPYDQDRYVIFDGNGRFWAMKEAFGKFSNKLIEVKKFQVDHALFKWAMMKTLSERHLIPEDDQPLLKSSP